MILIPLCTALYSNVYMVIEVTVSGRLPSFSGPMCILLQGNVTMEELTLRCFCFLIIFFSVSLSIWENKFLANHNPWGYNFQDCAGVILSTAERATQVALQVKDSALIPFYLYFCNWLIVYSNMNLILANQLSLPIAYCLNAPDWSS